MIVKVKEPQANERKMLREGQLLFTYLHLAPDPAGDVVHEQVAHDAVRHCCYRPRESLESGNIAARLCWSAIAVSLRI